MNYQRKELREIIMHYLKDQDWYYFVSDNGKKDGLKFETLVIRLLEARYGKNKWIQTQKSWDGSKDFFYYYKDRKMWAECKNYRTPISLDVLSPTLIMAQIYDINEILYFSYSPIVPQTKAKLLMFAEKSNKNVFFFDDDALEELILEYKDTIFPYFFSHLCGSEFHTFRPAPYIQHNVVSSPLYQSRILSDSIIFEKDFPDSINLYSVWGICLTICNRSKNKLRVNIALKEAESSIYQFDVLTSQYLNAGIDITLKPYESATKKILLRVIAYSHFIFMPKLSVFEYETGKEIYHINFKKVQCNWIAKTPLIGKSYREIIDIISNLIVNRERFLGICFWGASGNGKSRMLEECIHVALKYDYSILQFNGQRETFSHKTFAVLKEIILAIFNIPDADILQNIHSENNDIINNSSNKDVFIMLQSIMMADSIGSVCKLIDKYIDTIYERLLAQRYAIVIDNVQFFDDAMIYFLSRLSAYMINSNRYNPTIMLCAINTDYLNSHNEATDLLLHWKTLQNCFLTFHLTGFNSVNESLIYLRQLLTSNISVSLSFLQKIIDKTGNNPLLIFHTIEWFKDREIIIYANDYYQMIDSKRFFDEIDKIPPTIHALLNARWAYFINYYPQKESINIISLIHFFRRLPHYMTERIGLDLHIAEQLVARNFLIKDDYNTYYFAHDMIEKFFSENFKLVEWAVSSPMFLTIDPSGLTETQKNLYMMFSRKKANSNTLMNLIKNSILLNIPRFQQYEYFNRLFYLIENAPQTLICKGEFIKFTTSLAMRIRDLMGSKIGLIFFDRLYAVVMRKYTVNYYSPFFAEFMFRYCEAYDHIGDAQKSLDLLAPYTSYLEKKTQQKEDEALSILCECYNRLHVYHSHLIDFPLKDSLCRSLISKSFKLNSKINNPVMLFTNYSDFGYLFYNNKENHRKVLFFWQKACDIFSTYQIKEKTLNFIRKSVQISLINCDMHQAEILCKHGLDYCDNGEYAYERLHFKQWFSLALLAAYLGSYDNFRKCETEKFLSVAEEYHHLLQTAKSYKLFWLKGIYCYRTKQYKAMLETWVDTAGILENTPYKKHNNFNLQCVKENLFYTLVNIEDKEYQSIRRICEERLPFELFTKIEKRRGQKNAEIEHEDQYCCASILQDEKHSLNLPLI